LKDRIKELVTNKNSSIESTLVVREYLQARILEALQGAGAFQSWAFLGGTALRFLYNMPRFSEDLDFSLVESIELGTTVRDEFTRIIDGVQRMFEAEAYDLDIRMSPERIVQSAFIDFPGLLLELGIPAQQTQKISIKIEVDTNPPPGASTEVSVVRKHVFLNILHYDKASLFAGKLHALLSRSYLKGRDLYDLLWYLSDRSWPEPNIELLHSALRQTGTEIEVESLKGWRTLVLKHLEGLSWDRAVADVVPFLERSREIELLTRENILSLLRASG
jgi:predicted nucleotidyltransferase component of viral defense system